jgi:hypothetical protein
MKACFYYYSVDYSFCQDNLHSNTHRPKNIKINKNITKTYNVASTLITVKRAVSAIIVLIVSFYLIVAYIALFRFRLLIINFIASLVVPVLLIIVLLAVTSVFLIVVL